MFDIVFPEKYPHVFIRTVLCVTLKTSRENGEIVRFPGYKQQKTELHNPAFILFECYSQAKLLMCADNFDFKFAALLRWIILRFANLSNIFCTLGYKAKASVLSVTARSFLTALRMVFA